MPWAPKNENTIQHIDMMRSSWVPGRRSTWRRIRNSSIRPTFTDVVCGDIAMALPERILTNLMEGLETLNHVVPGVANAETLLYAPEIKFFATQVQTNADLQTPVRGMYVAGDGPGVAGNIVSSAATGLLASKAILRQTSTGEPLPAKEVHTMEKKVLNAMKKAGKPVRPGEIAKMIGEDSKAVSEVIAQLKKKGKVTSPKRCYYSVEE